MAKFDLFAEALERRILRGDYDLDGLPGEQELANGAGVSRMTARRALLCLMETGLIQRKPHGRLMINSDHERLKGIVRLALLTPAFASPQYENWTYVTQRAAENCRASVRVIHYLHWDAPEIVQALTSFDGVFLVPGSEQVPKLVRKRLSSAKNLVVLDGDLTGLGIPSIQASQSQLVRRMGDHLYDLGHRTIDVLNTQPHDVPISTRLKEWRHWKEERMVKGKVFDHPVEPYEAPTAQAYRTVMEILSIGCMTATALLCLTNPAADGATRALYEHGLFVGRDISVCAVDGAKATKYLLPSRTAFEQLDLEPYVERCIRWIASESSGWEGPLLIQPEHLHLFEGESTRPVPQRGNGNGQ